MNFTGTIIEESLNDTSILNQVKILETNIEPITESHKTPWVSQWTLHTVEISEENAENVAKTISDSIDTNHKSSWYADFKNDSLHYIIFPHKIFKINRRNIDEYNTATRYGVSIGIPEYQVNFSSFILS